MSLIPAFKKDERLIEEMDFFLPDTRQVHLWWLGQSGYLIQWQGCRLLIDPYLSDALTVKYAHTDKPHVRMSERVVDPERLRNINVITSSHHHTDHLDADTLLPVLRNNPRCQLVIPEANRSFVTERLGCALSFPVGLNDGQKITLGPFTFYGMPAKHNEITRDASGNCAYMGYVMRMGNHTIYHSGDTLWFEELVTLLRPFSLDLALLPINGNDPARRVAGNLSAAEAVQLAKAAGARFVIPGHYHLFQFNSVEPEEFIQLAREAKQPFVLLQPGQHWVLPLRD